MARDVPPDFDADWYAANYPDVGLSGLSPREHYRRFGKGFGRKFKAPLDASAIAVSPAANAKPKPKPKGADAEIQPVSPLARTESPEPPPIIDRPEAFDPAATLPKPAPQKAGGGPGQAFRLDTIVTVTGASKTTAPAIAGPLQAYARLLNLEGGTEGGDAARVTCGAEPFLEGPTRISNAWLADPQRLRLMFGDGERTSGGSRCAFRAYQADPASPAELRILGQGVTLPPEGPVIHDLELVHPLMPVLLELSDAEGVSETFTLLPFPSLLPGGLHSAELRALQTEPNPMDDLWALSNALLQEAVGGGAWPDRSVSGVSMGSESGTDGGLVPRLAVQEWLASVFQLPVAPSKSAKVGLQLVLPADCVPTVSALASRRLEAGTEGVLTGPYLVVEADSYRPRWSISLPAGHSFGGAVPALRKGEGKKPVPPARSADIPLAIAIRSPMVARPSGPAFRAAGTPSLSILLCASDGSRAERLIDSVYNALGREIEWLVSVDRGAADVVPALDRACGVGAWTQVAPGAQLRQIAQDVRHEILLTLSDRIEVADAEALHAILGLLERDESAGSASCALLAEKIIKKKVVLQPASGGLFPTAISLVGGPRLTFGEPDVLQALRDLDYPVVANTRLMTAWRRSALTALPPLPETGAANAEDIRLGLDLMRAGYQNWCTTRATASLTGSYVPRDAIDPVGAGYLPPDGLQEILSRVALVRELF